MSKICLAIVFNHRYDKNLAVLRNLYKDRFSNIVFLVPAYDGPDQDVIPVYICSYYFQGYFPQAYNQFKKGGYSHYIFIADDMILNPMLNEDNIIVDLKIGNDTAFITEMCSLVSNGSTWAHIPNVVRAMEVDVNRNTPYNARVLEHMLPLEEALKRIGRFVEYEDLTARKLINAVSLRLILNMILYGNKVFYHKFLQSIIHNERILNYPLVYGYSDFIIIPENGMEDFCRYCGLFAIKNLFVEAAVPTSMAITQKRVAVMKDTPFERGDYWGEEAAALEKKCDFNLNKLWETVGHNRLYVHPVKLSRWKV